MRIHHLVPLLALVLAPACKKKSSRVNDAFAKFSEFTDRICSCKDKACTDRVQEDMTRWSTEMSRQLREEKPTDADRRKMQDLGQRYAECISKVYAASGEGPPTPPAITTTDEKITSADRVIKLTYDGLGEHHVSKLRLSYVRADGTLDETYGEATIELGKPKPPDPADDPNRPIGAPVPAATQTYDIMARCPSYLWKAGTRRIGETSCMMFGTGIPRPKCSVVEVWKRAIDKGAPAKALAVLELSGPPLTSWRLSIDDAPRDIHFSIEVEDTCDPTLERPQ